MFVPHVPVLGIDSFPQNSYDDFQCQNPEYAAMSTWTPRLCMQLSRYDALTVPVFVTISRASLTYGGMKIFFDVQRRNVAWLELYGKTLRNFS